MAEDPDRVSRILAACIEEFKADGCDIVRFEGEDYARIVADDADRPTVMMDINLNTLARQIDRRLK